LFLTPVGIISFRLAPPLIAAGILQKLSQHDYVQNDLWGSFGKELVLYSVLAWGGGIIAWRIINYLIWKLENFAQRDIYRTMFNKFIDLSASYHADTFGGSLVSQTNKLATGYMRLADTFIYQFYGLVISMVFISVVLFPKAPVFVWTLLGFSALFITFAIKLSKEVRELGAIEASAQNKVTGFLADAITNILAIKSFAAKKHELKRFNEATENARHKSMDLMRGTIKMQFYASLVTSSILVMSVIIAVIAVTRYGTSASTVFLMFTYASFVGDALWEFSSSTVRNYNRAIGDSREAIETLQSIPTVQDPAEPEELKIKNGEVEFRNVTFDHEDDLADTKQALFSGLNLTIKPGEKVGLVGPSGGGKTTITKLLLRFMDVDSGEILIDGQRIDRITQEDLRSSIAYVPQEPLLFHRTLSENISYGTHKATSSQILNAAKHAHAHDFIEKLPNGYDTLVGERGIKLSGGQRQRIAIARAMIKDAPILVLDEATSALDSESEKYIQDALWKLMEGRTAIVIAHRLSTIQKVDRIVVLEDGKVAEQGTHKELLENKGIYANLWGHQSGGFLED
jgi:ATP-binding cassette subfamily B protein